MSPKTCYTFHVAGRKASPIGARGPFDPARHIHRIDRLRRLLKSCTAAAVIRREFRIPRYTPPADVPRGT